LLKITIRRKRQGPCFSPRFLGTSHAHGMSSQKGDVFLHERSTDNGPRLREACEIVQRTEQKRLTVPLLLALQLMGYKSQILNRR
jgi:hypothetical protein